MAPARILYLAFFSSLEIGARAHQGADRVTERIQLLGDVRPTTPIRPSGSTRMGAHVSEKPPGAGASDCGLEHTSRVQIEDFRDLDLRRQKPLSTRRSRRRQCFLDIAIVGLGCSSRKRPIPCLLGADPDGAVAFRDIPSSRWNHARIFLDDSLRTPDKAYTGRGVLDDAEIREFGASLRLCAAARAGDRPQHRLLLDVVRCALQRRLGAQKTVPAPPAARVRRASVSEYKDTPQPLAALQDAGRAVRAQARRRRRPRARSAGAGRHSGARVSMPGTCSHDSAIARSSSTWAARRSRWTRRARRPSSRHTKPC